MRLNLYLPNLPKIPSLRAIGVGMDSFTPKILQNSDSKRTLWNGDRCFQQSELLGHYTEYTEAVPIGVSSGVFKPRNINK